MNYCVSEEVPQAWDHIIRAFIDTVEHDLQYNSGTPIEELEFSVRNHRLHITYKYGDRVTDAFAAFAREMSKGVCTECSLPATKLIFDSPKCDNCY